MDWSYLSGFIDGEGSIVIYNKPKHKRVSVYIPNTNKDVVYKIHKFLKCGNVYEYDRKPKIWKPYYVFKITAHKKVLYILKKIQPFVIVKKEKVEKAIKFIEESQWLSGKKEVDMILLKKLRNEGKSLREIGKILKISYGTVNKRLLLLK